MDAPLYLLLRGMLIGLSLAAPVGPIGVLTIRRTLAHGRLTGVVSGLGTAAADSIYGAIGVLGLATLTQALTAQAFWLRLLGGLFLAYLGVRTLLSMPASTEAQSTPRGAGRAGIFLSAFFLTLTNPLTILAYAGISAGLNIGPSAGTMTGLLFVGGVFFGSLAWWILLSGFVGAFRGWANSNLMRGVNVVSGLILLGFAVSSLWALL